MVRLVDRFIAVEFGGRRVRRRAARSISPALTALALLCWAGAAQAQQPSPEQIARGKYLVEFGGCNDCHTPGYFLGKPDMSRYLSGSDVGFEIPGAGVFVGPNLTPNKETGLGNWSKDEIIAALQTGVRPDGRMLSPIMPWPAFAKLTKLDASAIADYLRSLAPVSSKTPGPFGPDEKPPIPVMALRLPEGTAKPVQ